MTRAISPVFGTLMIATITVALAAILVTTVGTAALGGTVGAGGEELTDFTRLSAEAGPNGEIRLTHEAGASIDVTEITVRVTVDGESLAAQPPVPFFSTEGFEPGPTGPFNSAADPVWSVGETASFAISDTNDPVPAPGDEVTVEVLRHGRPVAKASVTVQGGDG
ncbi:MAG: type IV pilin [Halodesulfurarchaeum sp.]